MIYLNRIEVIGNLTKDPELRFTPSNKAVASISIATNRRYKDQATGNWIDSPAEYHDVVVWDQLGERCSQILHKGDRIFVTGRIQTRSWEAQDGSKRYRTEIIADSILGPDQVNRGQSTDGAGPSEEAPAAAPKGPRKPAAAPSEDEINIDDIPF